MSAGGLYDPLGTGGPDKTHRSAPPLSLLLLVVTLVAMATLFGVAGFRDDGSRGEPRAVAVIEHPPRLEPAIVPPAPTPPGVSFQAPGSAGASDAPAEEVEVQNGVRIVRLRGAGAASSGSLVVKVPSTVPATDPRLVAPGPSRPLSSIENAVTRPADSHAGAVFPATAGGRQ